LSHVWCGWSLYPLIIIETELIDITQIDYNNINNLAVIVGDSIEKRKPKNVF
jgi:hypothetical protein